MSERAAVWEAVAASARTCTRCPELVATRTQVVPGVYPSGARLLLVGEAPGAQEDLGGQPFVGRSGQLLDTLLEGAGLSRADVAISNVLKCRPPENRKPRRPEVAHCRGWLEAQIEAADPRVVVSLGGTAAEWFHGAGVRLGDVRGRVTSYRGRSLLATYHPSAALRFGPAGAPRAALAEDLKLAASLLDDVPPASQETPA